MILQAILWMAIFGVPSCSSRSVGLSMSTRGSRAVGSTLTIDCLVRAPPTATVTLSKNSRPLENTERVLLSESERLGGGVHYLVTITSLRPSDSGRYTCKVRNGGAVSKSSTDISIRGSSRSVGLSMSTRGSRAVGSTLTIDCLVRAPPTATITLLKNSRPLGNTERVLLSESESSGDGVHYLITITSLRPSDSGLYTCEVHNGGAVSRSSTGISIRGSSHSVGLSMSTRGSRAVDSTLTIDCLVRAPPTATITLSKDSRPLENTERVLLSESERLGGGVHYLVTITSLHPSDSGRYTCEVRNGGAVSRSSIRISVQGSSQSVGLSMSTRGSRAVGSTLTIDCLVRAPPTATITLLKNSRPLENTERVLLSESESSGGGVHYLITITSLRPSDSGLYTCEVHNGGAVSRSSTGISIRGSSRSVGLGMSTRGSRALGTTLTIDCLVRAPPTATITLSKNSRPLENTERVLLSESESSGGGVHYLITITSLRPSDSGLYTCDVRIGGAVSRSSTGISIRAGGGTVSSMSSNSAGFSGSSSSSRSTRFSGATSSSMSSRLSGSSSSFRSTRFSGATSSSMSTRLSGSSSSSRPTRLSGATSSSISTRFSGSSSSFDFKRQLREMFRNLPTHFQ